MLKVSVNTLAAAEDVIKAAFHVKKNKLTAFVKQRFSLS